MKIVSLTIKNFKAISYLELSGLKDAVVIAGPNGCGKSTIFDAIRLIKSAYSMYASNDLNSWFSEFQINYGRSTEMATLLQDKSQDLYIKIEIQVSASEKKWLIDHAKTSLTTILWRQAFPNRGEQASPSAALEMQMWAEQSQVAGDIENEMQAYLISVQEEIYTGEVVIEKEGRLGISGSYALLTIFSSADHANLGIVDYHGPHRNYSRESINGLTLNLSSDASLQYGQFALFNYANKYNNIKPQLASDYIRQVLSKEAGGKSQGEGLNRTLEELFKTFFPDKEYKGPTPTSDGQLRFDVKTTSGAVHDINDLSSGEKEVLYGYLRLRNSSPRNSVLLIDEPEMHLNPRLVQHLPAFYKKYIGEALNNQLWLVTHSDALLRHATGAEGFSVFHMSQGLGGETPGNQVTEVVESEEIERVVIDLVGDLASYKPGAKVVILEGGGESKFDVEMITALFPEFASRVNLISGGNKYKVKNLYHLLQEIKSSGGIAGDFYSITDRDFEEQSTNAEGSVYSWDRYHIENYLLEPHYVLSALNAVNLSKAFSVDEVRKLLDEAARSTLPSLTRMKMQSHVNKILTESLDSSINPKSSTVALELSKSIQRSVDRIVKASKGDLSEDSLRLLEGGYAESLARDLETGDWEKNFRGRDILNYVVDKATNGQIRYTAFRNLIIDKMRTNDFKPAGMVEVLSKIILPQD